MVQGRWWDLREIIRRVHAVDTPPNSPSSSDGESDQPCSSNHQPRSANPTGPTGPPALPGLDEQFSVPGFIEPGTVVQPTPQSVLAIVHDAVSRMTGRREQHQMDSNKPVPVRNGPLRPLMTREAYEKWWNDQSQKVYETFMSTVEVQLTNTFIVFHRLEVMEQERNAERERTREAREKIARLKKKLARERMQWGHSMREQERLFNQQLEEREEKILRLKARVKSMEGLEQELMDCWKKLETMKIGSEDGPSTSGINLDVPRGTKRVLSGQSDGTGPKSPRSHEDKKQ